MHTTVLEINPSTPSNEKFEEAARIIRDGGLVAFPTETVYGLGANGLDSVAIWMPENTITLELITAAGCPVAAPSANLSGKPSPTSARHVIDDLDRRIDAVIDGGETDIGIESTVIDMTRKTPQILRPGKITKEQLESVIGKVNQENTSHSKTPRSPGMKYKHYAPDANIIPITTEQELNTVFKDNPDKRIRILEYKNETDMARNLFKDFRESDTNGYDLIVVWGITAEGLGHAIMEKVRKASGKNNS